MAAMVMSQVACTKLGGLQALPNHSKINQLRGAGIASTPRLVTSLAGRVRCEAGKGEGPLADAKAAVDQRPEVERRPETGSKSFFSVFAFDGAAPETINCRLVTIFIAHGYGHPNHVDFCIL
jgi:hypothetical protein